LKKYLRISIIIIFGIFLSLSYFCHYEPGIIITHNFFEFLATLIGLLPAAFILISLFEVWVKRETVERHLGEKSRVKGIIWAIILAGTVIGGLYVALPISAALYRKGARADVIFTFLFSATICRIPMTLFEANILGIKFTLIRFFISIPLVIFVSLIMGKISDKKQLLKSLEKA